MASPAVSGELPDLDAEWLEADGIGGFASGTVGGIRTRRYHALLLSATAPPAGRVVLVNGVEVRAITDAGPAPLSSQRYAPDLVVPDARPSIVAFAAAPWPTWRFRLPDGTVIEHGVFVDRDACETVLRWRLLSGAGACRLEVRPLLSGPDYHALHQENGAFRFDVTVVGGNVAWRPYDGLPAVAALTNGAYHAAPEWYRRFFYAQERDRGMDHVEDLASPGVFAWDLASGPAAMVLRSGDGLAARALPHADRAAEAERARRGAVAGSASSAPAYVVDRAEGRTVIAGFPWFTDWGRDTFIALRGLLLATGRLDEAERILLAWSGLVSEGMLPNRFPDDGGAPEFNSVDASLWFVIAVHDFLTAAGPGVSARTADALRAAVGQILEGYAAGTRFGIGAEVDGLLRAGVPGQQLTWMDAKVDDWVVTPRIGKPVEVQALWLNALRIGAAWQPAWSAAAERGHQSFLARFPDPASGGLLDVVDADGVPGRTDARVRPNQVFAVGGLPHQLVHGRRPDASWH